MTISNVLAVNPTVLILGTSAGYSSKWPFINKVVTANFIHSKVTNFGSNAAANRMLSQLNLSEVLFHSAPEKSKAFIPLFIFFHAAHIITLNLQFDIAGIKSSRQKVVPLHSQGTFVRLMSDFLDVNRRPWKRVTKNVRLILSILCYITHCNTSKLYDHCCQY